MSHDKRVMTALLLSVLATMSLAVEMAMCDQGEEVCMRWLLALDAYEKEGSKSGPQAEGVGRVEPNQEIAEIKAKLRERGCQSLIDKSGGRENFMRKTRGRARGTALPRVIGKSHALGITHQADEDGRFQTQSDAGKFNYVVSQLSPSSRTTTQISARYSERATQSARFDDLVESFVKKYGPSSEGSNETWCGMDRPVDSDILTYWECHEWSDAKTNMVLLQRSISSIGEDTVEYWLIVRDKGGNKIEEAEQASIEGREEARLRRKMASLLSFDGTPRRLGKDHALGRPHRPSTQGSDGGVAYITNQPGVYERVVSILTPRSHVTFWIFAMFSEEFYEGDKIYEFFSASRKYLDGVLGESKLYERVGCDDIRRVGESNADLCDSVGASGGCAVWKDGSTKVVLGFKKYAYEAEFRLDLVDTGELAKKFDAEEEVMGSIRKQRQKKNADALVDPDAE